MTVGIDEVVRVVANNTVALIAARFLWKRFTAMADAFAAESGRIQAQAQKLDSLVETAAALTDTTENIKARVS